MTKLSILHTVEEAYQAPFSNRRTFWRLGAAPMLVLMTAQFLIHLLLDPGLGDPYSVIAILLMTSVLTVPFAVGWYRDRFLGPETVKEKRGLEFSEREIRYLFFYFAVSLIIFAGAYMGAGILIALIGMPPDSAGAQVVMIAVFLAIGFFLFRLLLVLPMAALDQKPNFGRAWRISSGAPAKVGTIFLLTAAPIALLGYLLTRLIASGLTGVFGEEAGTGVATVIVIGVDTYLNFLITAVQATALGRIFLTLKPDALEEKNNKPGD